MRLLNVHTLKFQEFIDPAQTPPYVIASHRWHQSGQEATFKDVKKNRNTDSPGYRKVLDFCALVRRTHEENDGIRAATILGTNRICDWLWIDTACINKSDSAELSEAINSMFKWYARAQVCYAFLHDVGSLQMPESAIMDFMRSEWFRRGWTLQELLAPRVVVFLTKKWEVLGHKCCHDSCNVSCKGLGTNLNTKIMRITGISKQYLSSVDSAMQCPPEIKRKWAKERRTTRPEDQAYCLLGILDVNLPLIYGEGDNAWTRMEEAIERKKSSPSMQTNHKKSSFWAQWFHPREAKNQSTSVSDVDITQSAPMMAISQCMWSTDQENWDITQSAGAQLPGTVRVNDPARLKCANQNIKFEDALESSLDLTIPSSAGGAQRVVTDLKVTQAELEAMLLDDLEALEKLPAAMDASRGWEPSELHKQDIEHFSYSKWSEAEAAQCYDRYCYLRSQGLTAKESGAKLVEALEKDGFSTVTAILSLRKRLHNYRMYLGSFESNSKYSKTSHGMGERLAEVFRSEKLETWWE